MDVVLLGQRLGTLLEGGRRVSSYKLAVLLALIDASAEAEPTPAQDEPLAVSLTELADRVVDLYWRQLRPFGEHGVLEQNEQERSVILDSVQRLRAAAGRAGSTAATARAASPERYAKEQKLIAKTLAQQPLYALQSVSGTQAGPHAPFLFDDAWLHKKLTNDELNAHHWEIVLYPGVADGLVRLSGLLRPAVELQWVKDVARWNAIAREEQLLESFLFGGARASLARTVPALRDVEGDVCFYCRSELHDDVEVDHFVPWSRVPVDGLVNLVLAHKLCNGSKSNSLAARRHLDRWEQRDEDLLRAAARQCDWPLDWRRGRAVARGLYSRTAAGTPLWVRRGVYEVA